MSHSGVVAAETVDVSDASSASATAAPKPIAPEYADYAPRFALGRGQFGVVYLMQHPDGRKAVDKRVQLAGLSTEQRETTFREIDLLRKLQHEYVVRYYTSWETEEAGEKAEEQRKQTAKLLR